MTSLGKTAVGILTFIKSNLKQIIMSLNTVSNLARGEILIIKFLTQWKEKNHLRKKAEENPPPI